MKHLLIILSLFLSLAASSQLITTWKVSTISAMKLYPGAANRMTVYATGQTFDTCMNCVADESTVYAGAGGKKWKKITDNYFGFSPFVDHPSNPVIVPNGSELQHTFGAPVYDSARNVYWYYYSSKSATGSYTICRDSSANGKTGWVKDVAHSPVVSLGATGKFDETYMYLPVVWIENGVWRMLYAGGNSVDDISTGLLTSTDGVNWSRTNSGNPILTRGSGGAWDDVSTVEATAILKIGSTYHIQYDVNIDGLAERKVGHATTTDFITVTKDVNNPIYVNNRFCGDVFKVGSYYYNVLPHYNLGTNYAEFEMYRDTAPTFYSNSRTFLGVVKKTSATGWDKADLDVPHILTDNVCRNSYKASGGDLWMFYSGANTLFGSGFTSQGLAISSQKTPSWGTKIPTLIGEGLEIIGNLKLPTVPSTAILIAGTDSIVTGATNLTFDASNRLSIRNNTTTDPLEIHTTRGNGSALFGHSDVSTRGVYETFYRSRGTETVPKALLSGDIMLRTQVYGYDSTGAYDFVRNSGLSVDASENFTSGKHGTTVTLNAQAANNTGGMGFIIRNKGVTFYAPNNSATSSDSALLWLPGSTTGLPGTAPLKFGSGTLLTSLENGAWGYNGSHLYFTIGSTRYQIDQQGGITYPTSQLLTDATTVAWDYSVSSEARLIIGGNRTLSISNLPTGVSYGTLLVTQDGTGSRTITLPTGSKVINGGSGVIPLSTTANAVDILSFRYNSATAVFYWTIGKNYN